MFNFRDQFSRGTDILNRKILVRKVQHRLIPSFAVLHIEKQAFHSVTLQSWENRTWVQGYSVVAEAQSVYRAILTQLGKSRHIHMCAKPHPPRSMWV